MDFTELAKRLEDISFTTEESFKRVTSFEEALATAWAALTPMDSAWALQVLFNQIEEVAKVSPIIEDFEIVKTGEEEEGPWEARISQEFWALPLLVGNLRALLLEHGGENYLTINASYIDKDGLSQEFDVHLVHRDGKSPLERETELRARVAELEKEKSEGSWLSTIGDDFRYV
jgi:hypothetical protein